MHIQAGTVIGGMTLWRRPYMPLDMRRRMLASFSSLKIISGAAQSRPRTQIFIVSPIKKAFGSEAVQEPDSLLRILFLGISDSLIVYYCRALRNKAFGQCHRHSNSVPRRMTNPKRYTREGNF